MTIKQVSMFYFEETKLIWVGVTGYLSKIMNDRATLSYVYYTDRLEEVTKLKNWSFPC